MKFKKFVLLILSFLISYLRYQRLPQNPAQLMDFLQHHVSTQLLLFFDNVLRTLAKTDILEGI